MKMMVERYQGEKLLWGKRRTSENDTRLNYLRSFIDAVAIAFYVLLKFEANV